jgi:eukaryotic-like serine/threonine-protein kinase
MRLGHDSNVADDGSTISSGPGMQDVHDAHDAPPTEGMSIAGPRYEIGAKLGTGGMAEVFTGAMIGAEGFVRRVAIKRVLAGLSQVPAFATMFTAEARIASRLAHPNVVSVLDFRRDPEQRLFLVMEFVDGKDLASLLGAGPISPSLAIFIVTELLRGLGYLHGLPDPETGGRGVVHRDVSPQNLLLSYEGEVKLSDFGLARALAAGETVWSATIRGKPSYMSPEQTSAEPLDGRTDLYAAGVMLWEMLAHRPLFCGTSKEILGQVRYRDIALPGRVRAGVPPDLEAIAMKLLARDRNDRFPTAEAAVRALLQCHDTSRDGRGELVELLAERFPRAAWVGSRLRAASSPSCPSSPSSPVLVTIAAPPTTLADDPDNHSYPEACDATTKD